MSRKKEESTIVVAVKLPASLDRAVEVHVARAGSTKREFFELALRHMLADPRRWTGEFPDA